MLSWRGPAAVFTIGLFLMMCIPTSCLPTARAAGNETLPSEGPYHVIEVPDSVGGGFEPHILAAPGVDGTEWIYIDSPTGLGSRQSGNLYISKDHGDTWTPNMKGIVVSSALGSGDSYTAVTNDGTIYYTDLWLLTATVDTSNDGGKTWVKNPQASVTPIDDRQWLGLGPAIGGSPLKQPQSLYFTYNQIPLGLFMMKSQITKWGWLWRPCNNYLPITTTVAARDNFAIDQHDGTIYMPNTEGNDIAMYTSTNGCASFTKTKVTTTDQDHRNIFVISAVDDGGNIYVVWSTQANVSIARSTDKGASWKVFPITKTNGTRVLPWITAGDAGHIGISYYETNASGQTSEEYDTNVSWGVMAVVSNDALSEVPNFTYQPVINYTHSGAIRVGGTSGNSDRDLGDYLSDHVDQYGRHIITFGNDGNDGVGKYNAKVMFARQRDGPFLKNGTGPMARMRLELDGMSLYADGSASFDMNGKGLSTFEWFWGDGTNDSGKDPITEHKYKKAGTYTVSLRVTSMLDMRNTTYQVVVIKRSSTTVVSPGLALVAIIIIIAVIMTYLFRKKIKGLFGRKDFLKKKVAQ